jgi:hypothetical protein
LEISDCGAKEIGQSCYAFSTKDRGPQLASERFLTGIEDGPRDMDTQEIIKPRSSTSKDRQEYVKHGKGGYL